MMGFLGWMDICGMLGPPFYSASLSEKAENDTRLAGVQVFICDVMGFLAYCTC